MSGEEVSPAKPRKRWPLVAALGLILVLTAGFFALRSILAPARPVARPVADVSSERLLALGSVVGFAADFETHAWLGIPFARPPVGPLRWRAPRPPEAWADTLDALTFGSPCVQLSSLLGGISVESDDGFGGSEDCLTLNIWAPRHEGEPEARANLPVLVWIHGGGNTRGAAGLGMYNGARLAGTEEVIVVSLQYRLGPFGWFSHPALRSAARDAVEASGNFGTLDQIVALEWIRENIAEFGGDPENVTIFGQSAGGTNVFALLLADRAKGLFHRAIAQSGSTRSVTRAEAENDSTDPLAPGHVHSSAEIVVSLIESSGVVPGREAAKKYAEELPYPDLVELLRGRSARDILEAYRDPDQPENIESPNVIRDGHLLPEGNWLEAFRAGQFHHVPLLLGTMRDEEKLYLAHDDQHVQRGFGLLYRIRDGADYARRARLHSQYWAVDGVTEPANAVAEGGLRQIYAYRFDWDALPTVLGQDMSEVMGAAHGFELPLLFGTFDLGDPLISRLIYPAEGAAERETIGRHMRSYWAEFARTGRPGRGGLADLQEWPAWAANDQADPRQLVFDSPGEGGIRPEPMRVTRSGIRAEIEAAPDLDRLEKCELLFDVLHGRSDWDLEAFRDSIEGGCADFAIPPE